MKRFRTDILLRDITLLVMMLNLLNAWMPVRPMVLRLMLLLISIFVICTRWNKLTSLEKWMFSLSALNFMYFLFAYVSRSASPTSVANNLCAFLPLAIFIHLSRRGVMTERFVSIMTILLLIASVGYYVNYERFRIAATGLEDSDNLTINASTVFLMLLPLLFYEKKRILFFVELSVCVFFIISAVKRGNIVAAIIPVGLLMLYQYRMSRKNILTLFLVTAVVVAGAYFFRDYIMGNAYFMSRVDDTMAGETSNRLRIYRDSFMIWWGSDFLQIFFGNGYRAVTRLIHVPAHCDWLELLADNGLFGVGIYLGIMVSLFKYYRRTTALPDRFVLLSAFGVWFAKSIYSMAYVENYLFLLMVSIGLAIGKHDNLNQSINEGLSFRRLP